MATVCKGSVLVLALCVSGWPALAAPKALEQGSEYKLMLDPKQFTGDEEQAQAKVAAYWKELKQRIQTAPLSRPVSGELVFHKRRTVMFYDVPGSCNLNKAGYILRERIDAKGDRELTLKYRSADRETSKSKKVAGDGPKAETKFENDITAPSKTMFSHSSTVPIEAGKNINRVKDISGAYPGFDEKHLDDQLPLAKVGDLTVYETTFKKASVNLGPVPAEFALTLWYTQRDATEPALAEMSFSYVDDKGKHGSTVAANATRLLKTMYGMSPWARHSAVTDDETAGHGNARNSLANPTKTAWIYSQSNFCKK